MNRRGIFQGIAGGAIGLAFVAGLSCRRAGNAESLPPLIDYPDLPAVFAQELRQRRDHAAAAEQDLEATRELARLYHANRLYAEAKNCYDLVARNSSGLTARDHYYLADIARHQDDLERARDELRAVLAVKPGYLPAQLALAELLLKTGQEDAAQEAYSAVLAIDPGQLQASVALARLDLQQGREDAAVARLEGVMVAHPGSTSGAALLAQLLRRRGEVDRAAELAEMSQQRPEPGPPDPWMRELLRDIYDVRLLGLEAEDFFRTGEVGTAQSCLNRIEKIDPTSPIPSLLRGQMDALVHRDEDAVKHFREALTKGGKVETIAPTVTQSLFNLDRPAEAVAFMADYYRKMPESIPIAKAYAEALVRNGNDKAARPLLMQVLRAEPNLRRQNMELARILWDADERDAAVPYLERVATVHADDIPSRALLGEYFLGKGDADSAIPPLESALALATPQTPVHQQLAVLLGSAYRKAGSDEAASGKLAGAVKHFEQTTRILPDDPTAYAALGKLFVLQEQYPRAEAALERLVELQPKNPTILLSLGDIEHRQGESDAARQHWQEALRFVAAGDTSLREALETRLRGGLVEGVSP